MRKVLFIALLSTFIANCGNNEKPAAQENVPEEKKTATVTSDPDVQKGEELILKSDCLTCHTVADPHTGPPYTEIAKRYAGQPGIEDTLAGKIIKGGSGNWGTVPMLPHPTMPEADAKMMVKYIMSLKDVK